MEISDLISIGRVGFSFKNKKYFVKIKAEYQHLLPRLNSVFLIFKDHRVRYGKIDITKIVNNNTAVINIKDDDLLEELIGVESVRLALDEEDINLIDDASIYYDPIGMKVIWKDEEVGVIKDFFYNGAHYVYEIEELSVDSFQLSVDSEHVTAPSSKLQSILIPDVDAFVVETNVEERFIRVVELDQFIGL